MVRWFNLLFKNILLELSILNYIYMTTISIIFRRPSHVYSKTSNNSTLISRKPPNLKALLFYLPFQENHQTWRLRCFIYYIKLLPNIKLFSLRNPQTPKHFKNSDAGLRLKRVWYPTLRSTRYKKSPTPQHSTNQLRSPWVSCNRVTPDLIAAKEVLRSWGWKVWNAREF